MPSNERAVIYQIFLRTFANPNGSNVWAGTLSQNGCGKLNHINDAALAYLRELGVTHVWLTGLLRHATLTAYPELGLDADDPDIVKGRAGSPYAIRDYYDVCPDLAENPGERHAEFDALVARIHAASLKVLIDLVPNHVARSYGSVIKPELDFGRSDNPAFFNTNNDFYYLTDPPDQSLWIDGPSHWKVDGLDHRFERENGSPGNVPKATGNNVTNVRLGPGDWYETIKLNYGFNFVSNETKYDPTPSVWSKVDAIVAYWQQRGVDGFRCDFAHWVPLEFWRWLIGRARERQAVFFVAEAYDDGIGRPSAGSPPNTHPLTLVDQGGFDAVYDHHAFNVSRRISSGVQWANDFDQSRPPKNYVPKYIRYTENHDERRAASPRYDGAGPGDTGYGSFEAGVAASAALFLSTTAPLLIYAGQELGERGDGSAGYAGENGRTTIFDYWSPHTLRALYFAGFRVNELEPRMAWRFGHYRSLLELTSSLLFVEGDYVSLNELNRGSPDFGEHGHWAYAFLRKLENEAALVVVNLHRERVLQAQINVGEHVGSGHLSLRARPFDPSSQHRGAAWVASWRRLVSRTVPVQVPANSYSVWMLEEES